ncbi:MAG: DUF4148 domain-containing protein [Rubrivivax sp.]|nr:DUF4148 domain-containing protein [Rubrivivax sp.]
MNVKLSQVIATAALATLGTAAFAQEATYEYPQPATSTVTRAQVQAELADAKRTGFMRRWSTSYNHMAAAQSLKSRADVRAELLGTSLADRTAFTGEDSGSFALSRQPAREAAAVLAAR